MSEVTYKRDYYSTGQLAYQTPYQEGKKHGIERGWYTDGKLSHKTPYQEGEKHGIVKSWYSGSGQLQHEIPYQEGKINGVLEGWHENGRLECKIPHKENNWHGMVKFWDLLGRPMSTFYFLHDEKVTKKEYDKTQQPQQKQPSVSHKCTCDTFTVCNHGCQCGGV